MIVRGVLNPRDMAGNNVTYRRSWSYNDSIVALIFGAELDRSIDRGIRKMKRIDEG